MLSRNEADFSWAALSMTPGRTEVVDYAQCFSIQQTRLFLFKSHQGSQLSMGVFFRDLGLEFWIVLGFVSMILSIVYLYSSKFQNFLEVK